MRRTATPVLLAVLLLGGVTACSQSDSDGDCAAALSDRTGSDASDAPTVSEAKQRVDALDKMLADLVRQGYGDVADKASDAVEERMRGTGQTRPGACEGLSDDDYKAVYTAKAIDGLGWTDKDGKFDKLKMVEGLGD